MGGSTFEIAIGQLGIEGEAVEYLKNRRITLFARVISTPEGAWEKMIEDSSGAVNDIDVGMLQNLGSFHMYMVRASQGDYDYNDFDEMKLIDYLAIKDQIGNVTMTRGGNVTTNSTGPTNSKKNWGAKRDLRHLDECLFPNERDVLTKKKMTDWIDALLIVAAAHGVEKYMAPVAKRPTEPDPMLDEEAHERWIEDQEWLYTILRKVTKVKAIGRDIRRLEKHQGSEAYDKVLEYYEKHGSEGGAVSRAYDRISTLKMKRVQCGGMSCYLSALEDDFDNLRGEG